MFAKSTQPPLNKIYMRRAAARALALRTAHLYTHTGMALSSDQGMVILHWVVTIIGFGGYNPSTIL
eukprot:9497342-Pyramimonas_sp.AAC.2